MKPRLISIYIDGEVTKIDSTTIMVGDHYYEIVSPTEPLYPDLEYIEWDGATWVKQ